MFIELRFRLPETWIKDIKLKHRIISALIAIPLFLAIILFAPQPVYLAFWHLCIIACSYEFFKIRGLSKINSLITAAVVGSIAPVMFYLYLNRFFHETYLLLFCSVMAYFVLYIWLIAVPILFRKYAKNQQFKSNNVYIFIIWLFIISYFYLFTSSFSGEENYMLGRNINANPRLLLLSVLITIWANDAGAYFVGKAIGKHKFSPIISPNKTWEGFFGGIVIATIAMVIMYFHYPIVALCIAPFIAIFATIGDLFQSMLKRMAGVKDSGNIMPGHGGVFDRIDSWLAVGSIAPALLLAGLLTFFMIFGFPSV